MGRNRIQGKFIPVLAMLIGLEVWLHSFLALALGESVFSITLRPLYSRERNALPIEYEAGWSPVMVGPFLEKIKISCPCLDSSRRPSGLKHGVTARRIKSSIITAVRISFVTNQGILGCSALLTKESWKECESLQLISKQHYAVLYRSSFRTYGQGWRLRAWLYTMCALIVWSRFWAAPLYQTFKLHAHSVTQVALFSSNVRCEVEYS